MTTTIELMRHLEALHIPHIVDEGVIYFHKAKHRDAALVPASVGYTKHLRTLYPRKKPSETALRVLARAPMKMHWIGSKCSDKILKAHPDFDRALTGDEFDGTPIAERCLYCNREFQIS